MAVTKIVTIEPSKDNKTDKESSNEQPKVENPFNDNNNKEITAEDIKSEQDFKEAQTERD